ncbi:hypothetical protein GC722_15445 [Auraticoccus sp. F435]|uniref:DedA family protein n=1 Tax=Auraticoccus cholistanensis TaxID=2656650 RepID=A0A6A9UZG7_9ACTN|nr:hypothetical protein [Auraticoccus cholistanensis]MVA77404.1 hypothetical protein [Auraticoccus cholistanensis]
MWAALTVLAVAFVSAFVPVLNIEAYVVLVAASGQLEPLVLALVASVGQVAGKYAWYEAGRSTTRWAWLQRRLERPSISTRLDRWALWVATHRRWSVLVLISSASVGIPPFLVMSIVAGRLAVGRVLFLATGLGGRFLRFLVATGAVQQVLQWAS